MGLSNFPSASEGVLPIIVVNTVMSVAILRKLLRSFLELINFTTPVSVSLNEPDKQTREIRRVSIVKFNSSHFAPEDDDDKLVVVVECCVCLSRFEQGEELSELSCRHFFHKNCLDKWFGNHHSTCPLCRSIH